ncbi:MAG: acyl-CoA dehydrogenase, partial [Chloroflexi bacterium]
KTIAAATDRALVCLAAEEAGGAARCLEMSVAYAKQREQFGRPIGSFQAIAHRCVEMLQRVEFARAAARYAASCLDEETGEFPIAARVAAAYCGQAYRWVAGESIQVHGGIGFTWEHDAHLHYRRAWADEALLGTTDQHYMAIADRLGL